MKKMMYLAVMVLALGLSACGNSSKKQAETAQDSTTVSVASAMTVEDVLAKAEESVGKEITVKGLVSHTCKHSGRRCFIVGADGKTSIRVEAKGEIGGFNRELIGSDIVVKGILRENKLSKEYIDQMEKEVNDKKAQETGSAESCESEMNNIKAMREWMKANNKDAYSIYYVDGMSYEVAE